MSGTQGCQQKNPPAARVIARASPLLAGWVRREGGRTLGPGEGGEGGGGGGGGGVARGGRCRLLRIRKCECVPSGRIDHRLAPAHGSREEAWSLGNITVLHYGTTLRHHSPELQSYSNIVPTVLIQRAEYSAGTCYICRLIFGTRTA